MACRSCGDPELIKIQENIRKNEEWITREQVKEICIECYENMVAGGISRLKRDVFFAKLKDKKVKFYEIIFKGNENSKFNFYGHTLEPNYPVYFTKEELPVPLNQIKAIKTLKITEVDLSSKPTSKDSLYLKAKAEEKRGIMWVGAAPRRINHHGLFMQNVPRYDLSDDAVLELSRLNGFKVI